MCELSYASGNPKANRRNCSAVTTISDRARTITLLVCRGEFISPFCFCVRTRRLPGGSSVFPGSAPALSPLQPLYRAQLLVKHRLGWRALASRAPSKSRSFAFPPALRTHMPALSLRRAELKSSLCASPHPHHLYPLRAIRGNFARMSDSTWPQTFGSHSISMCSFQSKLAYQGYPSHLTGLA